MIGVDTMICSRSNCWAGLDLLMRHSIWRIQMTAFCESTPGTHLASKARWSYKRLLDLKLSGVLLGLGGMNGVDFQSSSVYMYASYSSGRLFLECTCHAFSTIPGSFTAWTGCIAICLGQADHHTLNLFRGKCKCVFSCYESILFALVLLFKRHCQIYLHLGAVYTKEEDKSLLFSCRLLSPWTIGSFNNAYHVSFVTQNYVNACFRMAPKACKSIK